MSARSQALVPLSTEQQAAWRAVAETEKRRHQGNTLAEYPYAGAFFRCLNGSRRISLSDLRFFMPSLTAEELHGNRLQWLYAIDVLIETQGEVCLLPLPGDAAERLFPSVRFRVRERSRHKSALVMQKYSRQQAREAEQKARAYQALVAQAEIELAFHSPETVGSWHARWSDRVANRVQCSITTLAIECGLATESGAGKLSITRATRALTFLSELGLITYQTEYDPLIGCYIPTDITFTPALFAALDVSEVAVASARRSRVEWENRQRKKQGLDALGMDELIAKAWRFVRERFRSYQTELKSRGIKRARARRDANRERQDIVTLVKRQLTREISEGRFTANREAIKREVERRVKERMILSRNRNYSRLATASP